MVPVSWALASADVNAGTASAARIAIIAITTSNSISVNADQNFFVFIFIVGFLNCSCSEGFLVAASPEPPWRLRSIAATKLARISRDYGYCTNLPVSAVQAPGVSPVIRPTEDWNWVQPPQ